MAQKTIDWFEKQREQKTVDEIAKKVCKNKASAVAFLKSAGIMNEKGELAEQYRQDEQVEPKFKVGDWVVSNLYTSKPFCITKICDTHYLVDNDSFILFEQESDWRLWTIQDAKDGDVLINWSNTAFIFKDIEDETVKFHIAYNEKWDAIKTPSTKLSHLGLPEPQFEFHPATKEQRDLLFQKMKEEGYEWDAEKKELRKVEQKLIDKIQPKFKVGDIIKNKKNGDTVKVEQILSDSYCYSGWDGAATIHSDFLISGQGNWELVEQKPADNEMIEILRTEYEKGRADAITEFQKEWSEEDEKNYDILLKIICSSNKSEELVNKLFDWFKSIKGRVQPQNLIITDDELAQAKKDAYNNALDKIEYHSGEPTFDDGWSAAIWYLKKRNAQPRNRWKPSEEQMKALHAKLSYVNSDKELVPDITLESLYNDLKKLKG